MSQLLRRGHPYSLGAAALCSSDVDFALARGAVSIYEWLTLVLRAGRGRLSLGLVGHGQPLLFSSKSLGICVGGAPDQAGKGSWEMMRVVHI